MSDELAGCSPYAEDIFFQSSTGVHSLLRTFTSCCGAFGNTVFFICSAWFLLDKKESAKKKLMHMLVDIWTVSAGYLLVTLFLRSGNVDLKLIIKSLFPTTFSNNWYMTCYILFCLVHPFLNLIIEQAGQKQLLHISFGLIVLYVFANFLYHAAFCYSPVILWIALYFGMAYMKRYMKSFTESRSANLVLLAAGIAGNIGIICMTYVLSWEIAFFEGKVYYWAVNSSPFLIVTAVALFNLMRMTSFKSRLVNYCSSFSMLIYIIHENIFQRAYYRPMLWHYIFMEYGKQHLYFFLLTLTVMIFAFSLIVSAVYRATVQKITEKISRRMLETSRRLLVRIDKLFMSVS